MLLFALQERVSEAVLQRSDFAVYGHKTFAQETFLLSSAQGHRERASKKGAKANVLLSQGVFDDHVVGLADRARARVQNNNLCHLLM